MRWNERVLTWALPSVLVFIFGAFAIMQFRWSNALSEAATSRMRASLQNSMTNFRQDLAEQLGILSLELHAGEPQFRLDPKGLAGKLEHWQATTSFPDLVSDVYVWNPATGSGLFRLKVSERRLELTSWPAEPEHRIYHPRQRPNRTVAIKILPAHFNSEPVSKQRTDQALKYGAQIGEALDKAHRSGIVKARLRGQNPIEFCLRNS